MFEKLTDHVYVYPFERYTDRPNIGLIVGEKYALLFEAGNSANHVELIKKDLAHIISTDAHNMTSRPPQMSVCLPFLQKHCDAVTVRALTWDNACRVIRDELI